MPPLDVLLETSREALREELEVIERLTSRAEKYLAAVGVVLAFQTVQVDRLTFAEAGKRWPSAMAVSGAILLGVSLIFALASLYLRIYPTYPATTELMKLDDSTISDDVAKRSVINLLLKVRDGVQSVNERRAGQINVAAMLLFGGFVITLLSQVWLRIA